MDDCIRVRRMHHEDRLSIREIRRRTGFPRKTIRKMLSEGSPPERLVPLRRARPKLGPFLEWVEGVLESDRKVPRKQRHTAWRIYERLRDERGYGGVLLRGAPEGLRALRGRSARGDLRQPPHGGEPSPPRPGPEAQHGL